MEFQEYIKNRNRMLDSIGRCSKYCNGADCVMCKKLTGAGKCFKGVELDEPEKAEAIVKKWADEHPAITNAQMYEKVFGYKPSSNSVGLPCVPHLQNNCFIRKAVNM